MNKTKDRSIIITLIILLIVSLAVAGYYIVDGAFFVSNDKGSVKVAFAGNNNIKLKNILAITDTFGKKLTGKGTREGIQGYLEFTIKEASSNNLKYEIYVIKNKSKNEINDNYIKFYLTDEDDKPVKGFEKNVIPNYNSLRVAVDNPGNKILYRGKIDKNEEKNFKLRVWMSDSSPIDRDEKDYSIDIKVRTGK